MNVEKKTTENSFSVFGGGCFWCMEAIFQRLKGVYKVIPGYSGGAASDSLYQEVCKGNTGHAEVVGIYFDTKEISYENLLEVFWFVHDPTTLNRQGDDVGTQYRSVIFYINDQQKSQAISSIKRFEREDTLSVCYTTEITPLDNFYPAEDYHRDYYNKNLYQLYCRLQISPKIRKFQDRFGSWIKSF